MKSQISEIFETTISHHLTTALVGLINHYIYIARNRDRNHTPWHNRLHFWFGRAVFLLAVANIPIGMLLYGSPYYCYAVYGVWGFLLLVTFVALEAVVGDTKAPKPVPGGRKESQTPFGQEEMGNIDRRSWS